MAGGTGSRGREEARPGSAALARMGRAELAEFVARNLHSLDEREVLQVLRHPHASTPVLEEILSSKRLLSVRSIRRSVASHPAAPRSEALRCLDDLPWKDLLEVGRQVRAHPPVRRSANLKLVEKFPRLSIGEKTAVARLADRDVIPALLVEPNEGVFRALLNNPRLLPEAIVAWITTGQPEPDRLGLLAVDAKWSRVPEVRSALLHHSGTPRAAALGLLRSAGQAEWESLVEDPGVDPLLSGCARRLLEEGA